MSPTTRHRCDVSSELCCPGAKPRRWALATRYTLQRNSTSIMKIWFFLSRQDNFFFSWIRDIFYAGFQPRCFFRTGLHFNHFSCNVWSILHCWNFYSCRSAQILAMHSTVKIICLRRFILNNWNDSWLFAGHCGCVIITLASVKSKVVLYLFDISPLIKIPARNNTQRQVGYLSSLPRSRAGSRIVDLGGQAFIRGGKVWN